MIKLLPSLIHRPPGREARYFLVLEDCLCMGIILTIQSVSWVSRGGGEGGAGMCMGVLSTSIGVWRHVSREKIYFYLVVN